MVNRAFCSFFSILIFIELAMEWAHNTTNDDIDSTIKPQNEQKPG